MMQAFGWASLALSAMVALADVAHAQTSSVKAIFEKHNLLGTFAWNCNQPASRDNLYYVNRALDSDRVQRDQMSGPTTRDAVTIIDRATELKPNEIALSGTRDGQPADGVWRVEGSRQFVLEATLTGRKVISGGRLLSTGRDVPPVQRCDGR
jgi:hypothetical protein